MTRIVCFIDTDGMVGTCNHHERTTCEGCNFRDKFLGQEVENGFSYTAWTGELYLTDPDCVDYAPQSSAPTAKKEKD